jgi:hypothetical protein
MIYANRIALAMTHDFEFSRNHWAVAPGSMKLGNIASPWSL